MKKIINDPMAVVDEMMEGIFRPTDSLLGLSMEIYGPSCGPMLR